MDKELGHGGVGHQGTGHGDRHLTQSWVNVPVPVTLTPVPMALFS